MRIPLAVNPLSLPAQEIPPATWYAHAASPYVAGKAEPWSVRRPGRGTLGVEWEWDPVEDGLNRTRRGISFQEASSAFADPRGDGAIDCRCAFSPVLVRRAGPGARRW